MELAQTDLPMPQSEITALIALSALSLAGAIKSFTLARRETTHRKCVQSFGWALACWCFFLVIFWVGKSLGAPLALIGVISMVAFAGMIWAGIWGLIGLVEYQQAPGRYQQGRAQAIGALVACVFFLLTMGAGLIRGILGSQTGRDLGPQTTRQETLTFTKENFRFNSPGSPWARVNATNVNRYAKLAFISSRPNLFMLVIPQEIGISSFTTDALLDIAEANLKSASPNARILSRQPARVGDLQGLRMESQTTLRGQGLFYIHWMCVTNGWGYQLVSWASLQDKAALLREMPSMWNRFELLDPRRLAVNAQSRDLTDFLSPHFQLGMRWKDSSWRPWTEATKRFPGVSLGGLHVEDDAGFVAVANVLPDPAPHPEAIYYALLRSAGLSLEDPTLQRKDIVHGGLRGIEVQMRLSKEDQPEVTQRTRLLHGNGLAYMASAWLATRHPRRDEILTDALTRITLPSLPPTAPSLTELSPAEKVTQRYFLNEVGMYYFNAHQFDSSATHFRSALDLSLDDTVAPYLANLVEALAGGGKMKEALQALNDHPTLVEGRQTLQANQAFFQRRLGQTSLALTNYVLLFNKGFRNPDHFREYISLLSELGTPENARRELENYLNDQDSPALRLLQANLLNRERKTEEAISLLKAQHEKLPFHAGIANSLADLLIQGSRHAEALALCEQMIEKQGAEAYAYYLKGRAEYGLRWYKQAKQSFDVATKKAPQDTDIRSFLDHVSGMLGEGSNTPVKEPLTPVALPAELLSARTPPPAGFGSGHDLYYAYRQTALAIGKDGELKQTDAMKVHAVTPAGASAFSSFQFHFFPLAESLFVNELTVRNAQGALVSTGNVSDYYLLDAANPNMATARKTLNIPVPGLQPGYSVELVLTRRESHPLDAFPFHTWEIATAYPVWRTALFLGGETSAVQMASVGIAKPERLTNGFIWRVDQPPVFRMEPMLPRVVDYLPTVFINDSKSSWQQLVTNYLGTLTDRMDLPAEWVESAKSRASLAKTAPRELMASVASQVQTNLSYKAIEFGRRARLPQPLRDTLRNKYGDCKDHALLAQQLLKAAGIPASLALVSSSASIRKDMPSLDQFDHMIVYAPTEAGGQFIDCTDKGSAIGLSTPLGLAGREALVLDERDPRFVQIPSYGTNSSQIRSVRNVALTNGVDAAVEETLSLTGVHASYLRSYLKSQLPAGRRAYFAGLMLPLRGELDECNIENLDITAAPLVIRLRYVLHHPFHTAEQQTSGPLPSCFERQYFSAETIDQRSLPFEISTPLIWESEINVRNTPEATLRPPTLDSKRIRGRFVTGEGLSKATKEGYQLHFRLEQTSGRFPATDYAVYCQELAQVVDTTTPHLIWNTRR